MNTARTRCPRFTKSRAVHRTPVALGLCLAAAAAAQEAPQAPPAPLPEVVVSATRIEQEGFGLPAAIDLVPGTAIREARPQVNLSEPLARVPGIVVQNRHNYAQDLQISARGFGARASFGVRGVRLLADGIPATMPDGQGQAASFNLSSAERIEVLRGPLAHLYGNAAGGVVQIFTADGPPEPQASASLSRAASAPAASGCSSAAATPSTFWWTSRASTPVATASTAPRAATISTPSSSSTPARAGR